MIEMKPMGRTVICLDGCESAWVSRQALRFYGPGQEPYLMETAHLYRQPREGVDVRVLYMGGRYYVDLRQARNLKIRCVWRQPEFPGECRPEPPYTIPVKEVTIRDGVLFKQGMFLIE